MRPILKSCPCCGSRILIHFTPASEFMPAYYQVECSECSIELDTYSTREEAVTVWTIKDGITEKRYLSYKLSCKKCNNLKMGIKTYPYCKKNGKHVPWKILRSGGVSDYCPFQNKEENAKCV